MVTFLENWSRYGWACCLLLAAFSPFSAFGQESGETASPGPSASPAVSALAQAPVEEVTLELMIRQGGPILWVIIGLAFIASVMALYFFFTVTPRREAPKKLVQRAAEQIRKGDLRGARKMCEGRDELMAKVLYAGLKMSDHDRYLVQEAMESEGERGATALWQKISYLNNIGVIAPLLGLLGTVWGMIGAFRAIAFDNAQVKGLTMAYQVSQAMITTAAGLLLAIPALMLYYYLRGRVVAIVAQVEAQASEFIELIVRNNER